MSSLLEHPQAQALLEQTNVAPDAVRACARHLTAFIQRYLPRFYRDEQRGHADTLLRGKLTGLQRKTTEPIATQAGQKRRPLQHFVGAGQWDDATVRTELRCHVREELGDPDAVLVLDNHGVPKQGQDSCGVSRQWCGRLGKIDNCQVGYFLAYATPRGRTLIDARLYLPQERADDGRHRRKTYVPKDVVFQEGWRIGLELLRTSGRELPHGWVTGDDEFGRASALRSQLRLDGERYVLDVPCNTLVRNPTERRPPARRDGRERLPLFERADVWAARQPKGRWRTFRLRDGEKSPRVVRALQQRLQTKDEDGCVGPRERLVVIRSCEKKPQTWYTLSNAGKEVPLAEVVRAHGERPAVEQLFEEGNQEVGLNHYEVRSWAGWQHHMTLTLLALWFLQIERLCLGKKNPPVTGSQVRQIFTELLRRPRPSAAEIAARVSAVLRRNEESRIYHWHRRTGKFPPPRLHPRPATAGGPGIISHSKTTKPYHDRGTSAWCHCLLGAGDWLEVDTPPCHIVRWLGEEKGVVFKAGPGPLAEVGKLSVKGKTPRKDCPCMKPPLVAQMEQV